MTLRRDHAPFRGQLAKARRAVSHCAALRGNYINRDGKMRPTARTKAYPVTGCNMPIDDWSRRMDWHRAWEQYGNNLGKERDG